MTNQTDPNLVFSSQLFCKAVLPLLKVIATSTPALAKKFAHMHCIFQVSARTPEGKLATHFTVNNGEWQVCAGKAATNAMVELQFASEAAFVAFFKGKMAPGTLPKLIGAAKHPRAFVAFMQVLLKMSALLHAKTVPPNQDQQALLTKCYFYLLSSGISALNKSGYAPVRAWTTPSPDRVYSWAVDGHPEVAAYIRIKAGKSRAGRGEYKRALPFFTLRFNSLESALGILLELDDMLEATKSGRLIMEGAPEFGAQLGAFMLTVGALAK